MNTYKITIYNKKEEVVTIERSFSDKTKAMDYGVGFMECWTEVVKREATCIGVKKI